MVTGKGDIDQAEPPRAARSSPVHGCRARAESGAGKLSTNDPKTPVAKPSTDRADVDNQHAVSLSRAILYLWVFPTSCAGLIFLPFVRFTGGGYQVVDGVLELYGGVVELFLRRCSAHLLTFLENLRGSIRREPGAENATPTSRSRHVVPWALGLR